MTHLFTTLGRLRGAFWLLRCSQISTARSLHSLYPTVAEVAADANCTKTYEPGYTPWINNTRISTKRISKLTPSSIFGPHGVTRVITKLQITEQHRILCEWLCNWYDGQGENLPKFGMWYGIYSDSLTGWKGRLWRGSRLEKLSRRILWFQNRQIAIKYSHWLQEI